jgi:hypothetical protein
MLTSPRFVVNRFSLAKFLSNISAQGAGFDVDGDICGKSQAGEFLRRQNRVSRQVAPGVKVELCLLCLPPGFPAVPHHFNLSPVASCPSQNRACAINAHGSPDNHSGFDRTSRCGAVLWPPLLRFCVRPVFPYSARPSVASFPPAALPAFAGTMRRSDSLLLFCLPPFARLLGILSVSLLLLR